MFHKHLFFKTNRCISSSCNTWLRVVSYNVNLPGSCYQKMKENCEAKRKNIIIARKVRRGERNSTYSCDANFSGNPVLIVIFPAIQQSSYRTLHGQVPLWDLVIHFAKKFPRKECLTSRNSSAPRGSLAGQFNYKMATALFDRPLLMAVFPPILRAKEYTNVRSHL